MASTRRPLLGDGKGNYRVQVTGNSGCGKTTLATKLAATLGVPYFSLDQMYWQPGWKKTSPDEFEAKVRNAMEASPHGWVFDGNHERGPGSGLLHDNTTDIIWLDTPFLLCFPRLILRTFGRLFGWIETCAPGCSETFREVFLSKESILWWAISHHRPIQRHFRARMQIIGIDQGSDAENRKMRRIGGWGRELGEWWQDVIDMVKTR